MAYLSSNSYGKGRVRLTKVTRTGTQHSVAEYTVNLTLHGAFEEVYTRSDNSPCVPTDTMKNTVYVVARRSVFSSPEQFATILARHFVETYDQIHAVDVEIEAERWRRVVVGGAAHSHAFVKDHGRRTAQVSYGSKNSIGTPTLTVAGGVRGMEVFRSGESGFSGFHTDEYTTLKDTDDRILATTVESAWAFADPMATATDYNAVWARVEAAIVEKFATHPSPSLQATLYEMGTVALDAAPEISEISFTMPNQHHILCDLSPFGEQNPNEVFFGTDSPFGVISGTVSRYASATPT